MNVGDILVSALKVGGAALGVGLIVGATSGVISESKRKERVHAVKMNLPLRVSTVDGMRDPLMELARAKHANQKDVLLVARRCETMLKLYSAIYKAHPSTVQPSLSATASQVQGTIREKLRDFYANARVPLVKTDGYAVPVNHDLRKAHETLMQTIDAYRHSIMLVVKAKLEQNVAQRV